MTSGKGIGVTTDLRSRVESELRSNILPFWRTRAVDTGRGGFLGRIAHDGTPDPSAAKGVILNARILWAFARSYRYYGGQQDLDLAHRAFHYIGRHFVDREYGGVYWSVDANGAPADTTKRFYAQAFAVYALAEFWHAAKEQTALALAFQLVDCIEAHAHDSDHRGYIEACARDWSAAADQRLSEVDMDEKKSMNTHLHLLEAYAALLRVHEDARLRVRLRELIEIFLDRIVDAGTNHFLLFFDERWTPRSRKVSFGHDIEGSWLLVEAAETLGDEALLARVKSVALRMAAAVLDEGIDREGGLMYEAEDGAIVDSDRHWWPQAEAVVGFLNAYELCREQRFLDAAERSWRFIEERIVDRVHGEWFWLVTQGGHTDAKRDKAGPWKCPYHNARACFEVMERLDRLSLADACADRATEAK